MPAVGDYAWSTYRERMCVGDRRIDQDPAYLELVDNEARRKARFARFVEHGLPEQEQEQELTCCMRSCSAASSPATSISWMRWTISSAAVLSAAVRPPSHRP